MKSLKALLAVSVVLAGCSGSNTEDLQQFMAVEKAKPGGRIEPLPAFAPYEAVVYSAAGLRSPFEPPQTQALRQVAGQPTSPPNPNRPAEFLERFNAGELTMVGSIAREGVRWGLIRDNSGAVHRVREGNYVGKNYGRIVAVEETYIDVLEKVPDGQGGWVERPRSINMNLSP
jgi:type IV pilus assembly protein PilP